MNVYYMYMYIEHRQTMHRWDTTCTAQMQGTCICTCTCTFIYSSKPLRLLYSLIIYEIVNFFFLRSLLFATSFFLYLNSVPIHVIVHVHVLNKRALCEWVWFLVEMHLPTRWRSCLHIPGGTVRTIAHVDAILRANHALFSRIYMYMFWL